jgi:hypothetical protein
MVSTVCGWSFKSFSYLGILLGSPTMAKTLLAPTIAVMPCVTALYPHTYPAVETGLLAESWWWATNDGLLCLACCISSIYSSSSSHQFHDEACPTHSSKGKNSLNRSAGVFFLAISTLVLRISSYLRYATYGRCTSGPAAFL